MNNFGYRQKLVAYYTGQTPDVLNTETSKWAVADILGLSADEVEKVWDHLCEKTK